MRFYKYDKTVEMFLKIEGKEKREFILRKE